MEKNYAYQSGAFKALVELMCVRIHELDSEDESEREWAKKTLKSLAEQAEETLTEFGYKQKDQDK